MYGSNILFTDSPVEMLRKELPRGDGKWTGFPVVYSNISKAAENMGLSKDQHRRGNEFHVRTMAVLGCGHEETMKAHQMLLREYGWI